jgi:hypothetical protein
MSSAEFHLVDLATQFEELEAYLRGTTLAEKEKWIATQGELIQTGFHFDLPHYKFTSGSGLSWPFFIRGDEIVVIGDHTVITTKHHV